MGSPSSASPSALPCPPAAPPDGDPRVHPRAGIPAEVWVEPTAEQWFWVRHFGRWFAPSPTEERGIARFIGRFFVVPSTNVTNFSLQYQSYLNDIFHLTKVARIGHFTCMPLITALALAGAHPIRVGPVTGDQIGAVVLGAWWLAWGLRERLFLWGLVSVAWAFALQRLSVVWVSTGYPVWAPLFGLAFLQAASHAPEPRLPPRVTGTARWMSIAEYLSADDGSRLPVGTLLFRVLTLVETSIYGTLDEAIASPRLAPIQLLEVLWLLGYAPERRSAWKQLSAKAAESEQPAIDYIGVGGGATLRKPG